MKNIWKWNFSVNDEIRYANQTISLPWTSSNTNLNWQSISWELLYCIESYRILKVKALAESSQRNWALPNVVRQLKQLQNAVWIIITCATLFTGMICIRVEAFQCAAPSSATLQTNAILHVITLRCRGFCCRSLCWKIDILYGTPVLVNCTALLARLCLTRTLQRTVAFGTALFTCGTVAFQTASSTGTALFTSFSLTDNWGAVTSRTAGFTFCGRFTCHVTISTWENARSDLPHLKKHVCLT